MEYTVTPQQMTTLQLFKTAETPLKSKQKVQKLIFIIDDKLADKFDLYTWKKYDYGPYSKQLPKDITYLDNQDFIKKTVKPTLGGNKRIKYETTTKTTEMLTQFIKVEPKFEQIIETVESTVSEHQSKSTRELIHFVYDLYPEYIQNTVWRI